ncbi:MAG: PilZ domain-containing protein [Chloroflexi bacterium]|nr:PilZ domain-containing protein [Chloroflexota bacterium]
MDNNPTPEKRQANRVKVRDLRVRAKDTGELMGSLVNLSFGGMLINSTTPYETKSNYNLRIPLEGRIVGRDFLDIVAECVWCNNDVNPLIYSVGLIFPAASDDNIAVIQQINSQFQIYH